MSARTKENFGAEAWAPILDVGAPGSRGLQAPLLVRSRFWVPARLRQDVAPSPLILG
jgi:hypothetical protein